MNKLVRFTTAAFVALLLIQPVGCDEPVPEDSDVIDEPDVPDDITAYKHDAQFRAYGDEFQIKIGSGDWQRFYPKGANLSVATPGKFPGELNEDPELYDVWFQYMTDLNSNIIRIYTLHHPIFYQKFGEWNEAHPDHPLYLVQGIWLDELEEGDYISDGSDQLDEEIRYVIDAVHGRADIPLRYGKAFGKYRHDVSDYVMAWLPGHEMMGEQVLSSNDIWAEYTRYNGTYVRATDGLPIEAWVARGLDSVVLYEYLKYGKQRPVGWSNWPALDPIHHPTETNRFGQDLVDANLGRFETVAPFTAGIYVSYHIYPFNPEFIIYDPDYRETYDSTGMQNNYLGYLKDLKSYHQGIPLFVTEFGVPSSFGVAHINDLTWNHGGYTEDEQAEVLPRLVDSIVEANCAGVVVFELMDEWFKRSWLTNPTMLPSDRGRLWYDVMNPEESFGLVSYYPVPGMTITVDGSPEDWNSIGKKVVEQAGTALAPAGDGKDDGRTLTALHMAADPAFLFLRIDTKGNGLPDLDNSVWYFGISTIDGDTGDLQFPSETGLRMAQGYGLEAAIVMDGADGRFDLMLDSLYDPSQRLNGESPNGAIPISNDDGEFQLACYVINNDDQYIASGKPYIPEAKYYCPGLLHQGTSTEDTRSHFQVGPGIIEIRLPWQALGVTDPSSLQVLFDDPGTDGYDSLTTPGFTVAVAVFKKGGAGLTLVDTLPRSAYDGQQFGPSNLPLFTWDGWDEVSWVDRIKPSFYSLADSFGGLQ